MLTVLLKDLNMNDRACPICSLEIECEEHVLGRCIAYNNYTDVYSTACNLNDKFNDMNDCDKCVLYITLMCVLPRF